MFLPSMENGRGQGVMLADSIADNLAELEELEQAVKPSALKGYLATWRICSHI